MEARDLARLEEVLRSQHTRTLGVSPRSVLAESRRSALVSDDELAAERSKLLDDRPSAFANPRSQKALLIVALVSLFVAWSLSNEPYDDDPTYPWLSLGFFVSAVLAWMMPVLVDKSRSRRIAEPLAVWRSALERRRREERASLEVRLSAIEAALEKPDPLLGCLVLQAAFLDNQASAAPLGIRGSECTVVLAYPGVGLVSDREPYITPGGRLSLRSRTKTDRHRMHREFLGSEVLATVRETFEVVPGIATVLVIIVQADAEQLALRRVLSVGSFDRIETLRVLDSEKKDPLDFCLGKLRFETEGRVRELVPLGELADFVPIFDSDFSLPADEELTDDAVLETVAGWLSVDNEWQAALVDPPATESGLDPFIAVERHEWLSSGMT